MEYRSVKMRKDSGFDIIKSLHGRDINITTEKSKSSFYFQMLLFTGVAALTAYYLYMVSDLTSSTLFKYLIVILAFYLFYFSLLAIKKIDNLFFKGVANDTDRGL